MRFLNRLFGEEKGKRVFEELMEFKDKVRGK